MKPRWFLLVLAGVGILSLVAGASDWPQWRGPQRTGISRETGLLKQWPADGPKLFWQAADIGEGYATPAVAGTRLYLLSNRGLENESVQALSVDDGKMLWSTRLGNVGNPKQEPPYPMARSTPTVDGDRITTRWVRTRRSGLSRNCDGQATLAEKHPRRIWRHSGQVGVRRVASGRW